MAKSYESLMGAIGRSVFYRPERQRVRELLSRDAQPKLLINGEQFPLFDISMNGVSFLSPNQIEAWQVDHEIELTLVLHEEEVYTGPARVARVEPGPRGVRIGLGLSDGFLDLPEICRQDDEKKLDRALRNGPKAIEDLVPAAYREAVSHTVHFLQFHRRSLDYHERRLRSEGEDESAVTRLMYRATEALREPWFTLEREASRAAIECLMDRDVLIAAKEFTEAMVVPCILDIPLCNRAYSKPLGYPGDYQVMLYYYADGYEGDSVFTRVMHKLHMEHPLALGVRARKDFMVEMIEREHQHIIERDGNDAVFRVVSLGCGPARETSDYVAKKKTWPGRLIWTLIDQEEKALSVAYRASQKEISRNRSNCSLSLLNLSFVQMLSEGLPLRQPGSQNFIFSTGLFDYVRESRAQTLVLGMYELLAPGGVLAIGNAIAPNEHFWAPEFMGDWTMLYRTEEEMRKLAARLPDNAEIEVVKEPAEAYYFLIVGRGVK